MNTPLRSESRSNILVKVKHSDLDNACNYNNHEYGMFYLFLHRYPDAWKFYFYCSHEFPRITFNIMGQNKNNEAGSLDILSTIVNSQWLAWVYSFATNFSRNLCLQMFPTWLVYRPLCLILTLLSSTLTRPFCFFYLHLQNITRSCALLAQTIIVY